MTMTVPQPSHPDFENAVERYLNVQVDFGGEQMSRGAVLLWFAEQGYPERAAGLWLAGYENTRVWP